MGEKERIPIQAVTASAWGKVEEQCRQAGIDSLYQQTVPAGGTTGGTPALD